MKRTLKKNIKDNLHYENLEFVVLNYNSKDHMDEWMRKEMMEYIQCRKLVYVKTPEPEYFRMAHAKNMVTKFASGDIVCNIDADNFAGKGFASYVNEQFNRNNNIFLVGGQDNTSDLSGRICLWKSDFLKIGGYDEKILDYGYEDTDVYARLSKLGRTEIRITGTQYLKAIPHDDEERMVNGRYYSEVEFALVFEKNRTINAYVFKVNGQCEFLTIVPSYNNELIIDIEDDKGGTWRRNGSAIECMSAFGDSLIFRISDAGSTYSVHEDLYRLIPKADACLYYSVLKGRTVFRANAETESQVNPGGFGKGMVYEVFGPNGHLTTERA